MNFSLLNIVILLIGLINLLPLVGVISGAKVARLYAVTALGHELNILLRHRALLFGLIGGLLLYSLFDLKLQWAALSLAGLSMFGFIVIAVLERPFNEAIKKVVIVDTLGLLLLALAGALKLSATTY